MTRHWGGYSRAWHTWRNGGGSGHGWWLRWYRLSSIDFRHSSHTPAPKPRILIAVPPAVHRSLNQSSLPSQCRVQLRQGPANGVAFCFVDEPVPSILIFAAAGARIHTVLCLELLAEVVHINRFDIASDCIFHFHAVSRILERNPLYAIVILPYNKRSRGRYGPWCRG